MSMIKVEKMCKKFKEENVLENIDFTVEEGDIVGIVGRNGCGKSVLFKILTGIMMPTQGSVEVLNANVAKGEIPKEMGVILDCTGFLPQYTALENLMMIADIRRIVEKKEICNILEYVGLDWQNKKPVKKYSIGMKQRLAFAQAIMEKPRLLILDEPFNGLDDQGVELVRKCILELNREQGVTVLLTSHIKEDIEVLCEKVFYLKNGLLLSKEKMEENK